MKLLVNLLALVTMVGLIVVNELQHRLVMRQQQDIELNLLTIQRWEERAEACENGMLVSAHYGNTGNHAQDEAQDEAESHE